MTTTIVVLPSRDRPMTGALLVVGIVLATLTEAIASTVLSLGRGDIIGDTYATPDEFAAFLRTEYDRWERLIRLSGVKVE